MNDRTLEFWKEIEDKLGYPAKGKALCEYSKNGNISQWGLLYASQDSFIFMHFPQKNWLSGMIKDENRKEEKTTIITIPFKDIIQLKTEQPTRNKGFFRFIFTAATQPKIIITYKKNKNPGELNTEGSESKQKEICGVFCVNDSAVVKELSDYYKQFTESR